ncbi:MAG: type I DNA topoisomerase, partial [candidate division Zixibacteria bacterium]|nr:type I DNA topoisomerase [candidate division Zixibacteria bacterium]
MSKNLLIVESPAKSRTLARFLGKDFEILSTIGHVVDLPKSKLGVDPKKKFAPDYHVIKGKEKVIAELRKAAKKADKIYLAPDPDREGEAIAWHVANELKDSRKKCVRVTFNEITKSAVTEAIKHPREIDINLVNAQQARRVLDRLVGYIVSPFLWKTVARNLSAGRVQSVALRLVCEREEEIRQFVQQEYWQIAAKLETKKHEKFEAQLVKIDDQTVSKPDESGETVGKKIVIRSQAEADGYIAEMRKQSYAVTSVKDSERIRKPSPPFITSTLQQEAAKAYGFSPKVTMGIAQALYEGVEVGKEGATGLITYMRTDSTRISKEALDHVRDHIHKNYGESYLPDKPNFYGRAKEAQDAHEAIRPTHLDLPPDKVRKHLTPQQFKLYSLIWNRFVSSQMTNAIFDVRTVDITGGKFLLRVTAQHLKFDGFLRLYHEEKEPDENGNGEGIDAQLPALKAKDPLTLADVTPTQSFTRPPARYSEASLIKRMEADGIGRPSTYASIVSTIKDRKYVELQERKLFPTDLGEAVNKMLVTYFPNIFN